MTHSILFEQGNHRNVMLDEQDLGEAVQANHHLIVHDGKGIILDPGGHKAYRKALSDTTSLLKGGKLQYLFLSHQDPDIVAAVNGWLMTTDADAYASEIWLRFIPHFGVDKLVVNRLKGVPDRGMTLDLAGCKLLILPAHFLHSCGNLHLYDPISRVLYSGDLGASLGMEYREVPDFDAHIRYMEGFHQRYMAGSKALRAWVRMVRGLDIETIAPQHGAIFRGKEMVDRFLGWCDQLPCGIDLMEDVFQLPG
ncbi:MAG: MBL fold metallo-hydrolase [Polyangiaceae bacterium]|jgi:flavorubredoxin|nr:MBL fold metallo-hydrolase [Polyangiaceae bacterium]